MNGLYELRDLAAANHVRFLFEAAVMGGAPIFSLFREALPAAGLERFRGILNSTTNLILTEMEHGSSFEAAVGKAQDLGTPALAAQVQVSPRPTPALMWTAGTPQ